MINIYELILYISIGLGILFALGIVLYFLKHYFKLKEDQKALEISKRANSKVYQLEKKIIDLQEQTEQPVQLNQSNMNSLLSNFGDLSIEGACELFGMDYNKMDAVTKGIVQGLYEAGMKKLKHGSIGDGISKEDGY